MSKYSDAADQLFPQESQSVQPAAQPVQGKYAAAANAVFDNQETEFRRSALGAAQANPDQSAKAGALARRTGLPVDVVERNLPDVEGKLFIEDLDKATANSPAVRRAYGTPYIAKTAKDDSFALTSIEQGLREFFNGGAKESIGSATQFIMGADGKGGLPGMVGRGAQKGYWGSVQGTAGAFRAATEFVAPVGDLLENAPSIGGNPLRRLAEGFGLISQNADAKGDLIKSPYDGNVAAGAESGFASLTQNAKYMPLMLAGPPGAAAALLGMALESGGKSYDEARQKGINQNTALIYGASDAAIEFATEKIPMNRLIGDVAANTGFFKTLVKQIGLEVPGEQIATALQDMNEWAVMNPEKSFGDYIAARPDAAVQTLVATIVGTGGNVAVTKALGILMDAQVQKDYNDQFNAERDAQDRMVKMKDILDTAAGSKLRELDMGTFRDVVNAAAEEHPDAPKSVHIDGQVLLQSLQSAGLTEDQLLEVLPSVAAQLADAATANSTVEIPIGELAAALPGTPLEQALLPHLRIGGPESLSQFEAEQAQEQAQEFLKTESERVMQESTDQVQWSQESQQIKATIQEQLDGTGRFSKDVTSKYATLVRDFYSVMASRANMTPVQLYSLMPYKVAGQGRGALDQTESEKAIEKSKGLRGMIDGQQLSQIQAELANYVKATAKDNISPQEIETATGLLTPMMERATAAKPGFDATVNEISRSFGNDAMLADVKGMDRAAVKLMRETGTPKTGPNIMEIRDLLRATVVVSRVEDIQAAIDAIGQKFEVLRIKNRFDNPTDTGYRDVLMNVALSDGTVAEIQINVPAMLDAKSTGHKLYEMSRDLPEGDARRAKLEAMQAQLYAKAFDFAKNAANRASSAANSSGVTLSPLADTTADGNGLSGSLANTVDPSASLNTGTPSTSYSTAPGGTTNNSDISNTSDTILPANGVFNQSVSTRTPVPKAGREDPHMTTGLEVGLDAVNEAPGFKQRLVDVVSKYITTKKSKASADKQAAAFIAQVKDNLLWLHDQVGPETRARSKLWYDGGRNIVDRWVAKYEGKYTAPQMAAALAAMSPKMAWDTNVSLSERIIDTFTNHQSTPWSDAMSVVADRVAEKNAGRVSAIDSVRGKTLAELDSPFLKGMWIRFYDEAHNDRSYRLVTPEGGFTESKAQTKSGDAVAAYGNGFEPIAKTVSILMDGSMPNISRNLGEAHKVRNFYNNIFDPSDNRSVTIDTHAVAAGLLLPLGASSAEVSDALSGPSHDASGQNGTYALFAEGYRQAAAERGVLPREMQSITWEAVRGLFSPAFKTAYAKDKTAFNNLWKAYTSGKATLNETRQSILDIAGGIDPPRWVGSRSGLHEGAWASSYTGELLGPELPRRGAESNASGSGSAAAQNVQAGEVNGQQYQQTGNGRGRTQGGSLAPLEGAPSVPGFHGPDPRVVAVAESYAAANGINLQRQAAYVNVDPERGARIAQAYAEMAHNPQDPAVKEAYQNLIQQTTAQYQALVDAGYKFHFIDLNTPEGQEYASTPWNAMRDMRSNQRMGVFSTEAGFGTDQDFSPEANPLLADTGFEWPMGPDGAMQKVLANDLFRAVHDAFGHGMEGAGFRAQGEENAWQAHVRLFTGSAIGAITTETRGQNSWLNFGPNGESNQTAKVEDTVFADQKTGLMPPWTWSEGLAGNAVTAPSNKYQTIFLAGRDPNKLSPEDRAQYDSLATAKIPQTEAPEFKRWFGDSKVVDADGKPLVVYHGTKGDFSRFAKTRTGVGSTMFGTYEVERHGIFVTPSAELANDFATQGERNKQTGANVMPLYASIKNPLDMTQGYTDAIFNAIEKWGNDKDLNGYRIARNLGDNWGDWMLFDEDSGQDPAFFINMLKELGYDGVKFFEPKVAGEGASGDTFVAFEPEQLKSAIGNNGNFDGTNPSILEQSDSVLERKDTVSARGTFDPSSLTTVLNENADLSTFLHETGHFFLEAMAHLASQPQSSDSVRADMTALLKWFGVKDLETWNGMTLDKKRKHHERFAESFEMYLLEGKAPNTELASLFRTFRAWLTRVYKSMSDFMAGRDLQLSDDIRQVMDRMLATEQQIAEAEKVAGLAPDLNATGEAIEQLQARSIRDLKWAVNARNKFIKELQQEAREKRKEVQTEVTAEVNAMPEFAAKQALDDLRKATKDNPSDADLAAIADAYGFKDYDSMLSSIDAVGKKSDVIEGLTDQRMLERYGDLIDKESIEQAATEAVHNAARAKSLATELAAQRDMLNPRQDTGRTNAKGSKITVNALMEAAKQFAANVIGRKPIRDLKKAAYAHLQAERRAAKAWEAATAKADTKAAVQAKQDQMLNNAAVRAAHEAQAEVKKTLEFFAKVMKGNDETVVSKGRDPDVVNAARAILAVYGVGAFKGKNAFEYMDLVKANDPALFAILDDSVRGAVGNAKPLDRLTVDELTALRDEIASMWHLAKSSRQYEVDGNKMDIEEAAEELTARMEEKGVPAVMPGDFGAVTEAEKFGRSLQFAGALLRRVESWAEGMDGKFGGPFLRLVFQPVKAAADRYRADRAAYRKKFTALVENLSPQLKPGLVEAPELGYTFGKGKGGVGQAELVSAMLHLGNESNKRKMLLGRGWATENADGTLDTSKWDAFMERMHNTGVINKAHYDFAQGVWDLLEEMKPAAQKTHRDVFGRYFAEVTADSFEVPGIGFYRGGYVPAQVDSEIVKDNEMRKLAEQENESMAYAFPSTNKGFTKARVEYNRPLMLDLRTLPQHIDKVLLFTHMEPAVRGVNKVLQQKGVGSMLGKIDPSAISGMLAPWLSRSARQIVETPIVGDGRISRVLSVVRARAGMSVMFANLSNTLQQVAGLTLAGVKVKPKYLTRAMAQYTVSPKKMSENVAGASSFMATRMDDQVAALNGTMQDILLNPSVYERAQNWTAKHAYFMQSALDNVIGPIVWSAAYNQALEQGMAEMQAVQFADGTIRQTQGSTLPEDVSRIETGPAYARIFTQFIGYFNMVANTNVTALQNIADDVGLAKGAGKALAIVFMGLLAPAWIAEAIAQGFKGGPDDEDKDGYLDDWLKAVFGMGTVKTVLAGVPFVGQFAMAGMNTWNDKPYDDRTSLSPAVSLLEGSVRAPVSVYKALVDDGNKQKAVRDMATAISLMTGLPVSALARPVGYLAGVADDKIDPTSGADAARGLVTGVASPGSK